jgi:hypothetical protein
MLNTILHDDFVWTAITGALSGRRGVSNTNFLNFNCPMCPRRGKTPDKDRKCGAKKDAQGIGINCFRCGFRTRYQVGDMVSANLKGFLGALGVPEREVMKIGHKAFQYHKMLASNPAAAAHVPSLAVPTFPTVSLPSGAKSFSQLANEGCTDPDFMAVVGYAASRGMAVFNGAEYYWTPSKLDDMNRRMILPFIYKGKIVGYTGRLIDEATKTKPRYTGNVPSHFLFNNQFLEGSHRVYAFIFEGVLDAVAVDGVSTLGSKLSNEQAHWLTTSGKINIVVADPDVAGQRMIDHALTHKWHVSFPKLREGSGFDNWWERDVKDAAEATKRYGKLYVTRSIIETATNNPLEIRMKRKLMYFEKPKEEAPRVSQ